GPCQTKGRGDKRGRGRGHNASSPPVRRLVAPAAMAALSAALLTACSAGSPSTMNPAGPAANRINTLWWLMFGVATFVCLLIGALVAIAIFRRRGPDLRESPPWAKGMVYGGGFAFPLVVLAALWVLVLHDIGALSDPGNQRLTVDVIGHQWWWEIRYP